MIFGYAWSPNRSDAEHQRQALKKLGVNESEIYIDCESECGNGWEIKSIQFDRLLSAVKEGDRIIAAEATRLASSAAQLCEIIEIVREKRLELIIGQLKIDCRTEPDPVTAGMLELAAVFAALEPVGKIRPGAELDQPKMTPSDKLAAAVKDLPMEQWTDSKLICMALEFLNEEGGDEIYAELGRRGIYDWIPVCGEPPESDIRDIW